MPSIETSNTIFATVVAFVPVDGLQSVPVTQFGIATNVELSSECSIFEAIVALSVTDEQNEIVANRKPSVSIDAVTCVPDASPKAKPMFWCERIYFLAKEERERLADHADDRICVGVAGDAVDRIMKVRVYRESRGRSLRARYFEIALLSEH